ncbi:LexA family transcriptional regulator [Pragia fontium]|uniref:Phage repressor protein C, contains Cro/C1-type HTH and peptisase s24 domains n=2 Tax=Pragia fontium TaxID=82985 RepID=A0AAJ4WAM5_9GAMM|nr:S24 family peptidase [Pragia fontium]GKX62279.1 transcriptional regulator [Pragia fontium]SFC86006.1 Phage repressor protein C, contains Cro/C1-type HTH and peptisase s24 domains [Pragia fontium DSM 5563 = ATCC 49100]SUB83223.1 Peptidase S24-like [Pragia fontium]VEJ56118.1 Peptidase S24-like [Pragia fontium]
MGSLSERLKQIMTEKNLNQTELAKLAGASPQSVTNWLKRNSMSKNVARIICEKTGYSIDWLLFGLGQDAHTDTNLKPSRLQPITWEEISTTNTEFVEVPVLDIHLSAGDGYYNTEENEIYTLPFRAHTLRREGIHVENLKVVRVTGDSMEPKLSDNDTVSIDTADKIVRDGKMYAIRIGDVQKIKTLIQNSDGSITMRSYNANYKDEIVAKEQIECGEFTVIGRVWWISSIV